jgi:hypothetical protein
MMYVHSICTSQETHYVSATKCSRLMLFEQTVAVYCENHTEHTNTLPNKTHYVFAAELSQLMLFGGLVAVY